MTTEDERTFLESLHSRFGALLMRPCWDADSSPWVEPNSLSEAAEGDRQLCLIRQSDSPAISFDPVVRGRLRSIDLASSEAIEFDRSYIQAGALVNGRLWFEAKGEHGSKSEAFLRWADQVLRHTKKTGKRLPSGRYAYPKALQAAKEKRIQIEVDAALSRDEIRRRLGLPPR